MTTRTIGRRASPQKGTTMVFERTDMRYEGRIWSAPAGVVERGSATLRYRLKDPTYGVVPDTSDPGTTDPWPRMVVNVSMGELEASPCVHAELGRCLR